MQNLACSTTDALGQAWCNAMHVLCSTGSFSDFDLKVRPSCQIAEKGSFSRKSSWPYVLYVSWFLSSFCSPLLTFWFPTRCISFTEMQASLSHILTWNMLLSLIIFNLRILQRQISTSKMIMSNEFDFLLFVSVFSYCSSSSFNFRNPLFLHKVLKPLMHGYHTMLLPTNQESPWFVWLDLAKNSKA